MLRTKSIFLAVILFILISIDLSWAKRGGGGSRGGGSRGGGSRGGGSRGSYYGEGDGSFDWTLLVGVIIGIPVFCVLCYICYLCCSFYCSSDEENERNVRHDSNGISNRSMVVPKNQQRNSNKTSMNMETRYQFHENLSQNSHHVTKLSPRHQSYPISPFHTFHTFCMGFIPNCGLGHRNLGADVRD